MMRDTNYIIATDSVRLKVKKLYPDAKLPVRMTEGSAGLDLSVEHVVTDVMNGLTACHTGIAVEIPEGYVGYVFLRGSSAKFGRVMGGMVGVIDSDYRGEIVINLIGGTTPSFGERIAQLIVQKLPNIEIEEVEKLSKTKRGAGAFGSTDKQTVKDKIEECKLHHTDEWCDAQDWDTHTEDFSGS